MKKRKVYANVIESGYDAFDGISSRNVFYFITYMNEKFDFSIFEESLLHTCNVFTKLKSTMVKGFFHDSWQEIQNFSKMDLQIGHYNIEAEDKESFKKNVSLAIENQEGIAIALDVTKQYPFKVIQYYNTSLKLTALLFCIHHAFCDGRSGCCLINYIGQTYNCMLQNKEIPPFENYYNIKPLSKKLYKVHGVTKNKKDPSEKEKVPKNVKSVFNEMYERLGKNENPKYRNFEEVVIGKEQFLQVKAFCKKNNLTINDFAILIILLITQKYNRQLADPSQFIGCSFTIDESRYIDTKLNTVGNYASFDIFVINSNMIEQKDYAAISEELGKLKKKILGLDFFIIMNKLNTLPIRIVRPVLHKSMEIQAKSRDKKSLSISNCGDLSTLFDEFKDVMYDALFIPSICFDALPQVGVSSYDGVLTLNIVKENDYNGCAAELRKEMELIIKELVENESYS